jgi:hypothetical protein
MNALFASLPDELVNKISLYVASDTSKLIKNEMRILTQWFMNDRSIFEYYDSYEKEDGKDGGLIALLKLNKSYHFIKLNSDRLFDATQMECQECDDPLCKREYVNYKWGKKILCENCYGAKFE